MKMKKSSLKVLFFICLAALSANSVLSAQTVLVHRAMKVEDPDENYKLYNQSAEAGIMDVLFDFGCIAFSETSQTDDAGVLNLAVKTGSEYILSWDLIDTGLEGRLVDASRNELIETVSVERSSLEAKYKDPSDLYTALGRSLCRSLVGDRW